MNRRGSAHRGCTKMNFKALGRVLKFLFKSYPVLLPVTAVCIIFASAVSSIPAIFQQKVLAVITRYVKSGVTDWGEASKEILPLIIVLIALYTLSLTAVIIYTQLMAKITQGFLT